MAPVRRNQRMEFFDASDKQVLVTTGLHGGAVSMSRVRYEGAKYFPVSPPAQEEAVVAHLHLRPQIAEISVDGRPPAPFYIDGGRLNLLDLRRPYYGAIHRPFEFVAAHIPFSVFEEIAPERRRRVMQGLVSGPTDEADDPEMRGLAMALLPAFERPQEANRLFADYVGLALAAHLGRRYGEFADARDAARGRLARWQERRAREMMDAELGGDLRLEDLARACGLSVGYFARAFRATLGMTPHQWLLRRRVELAKAMMQADDTPLAVIASVCGFSDQSHLSRVFRRLTGASPAQWRRAHAANARDGA